MVLIIVILLLLCVCVLGCCLFIWHITQLLKERRERPVLFSRTALQRDIVYLVIYLCFCILLIIKLLEVV